MKNKAYIIIVFAILCVLAVYAPTMRALESLGFVAEMNIGNAVENERDYSNAFGASVLTKVENLRVSVEYTYLNYMPFYSGIVYLLSEVNSSLNEPVFDMLSAKTPVSASGDPTDGIPANGGTETTDADEGGETEYDPDADIVSVSVKFINQSTYHRNYSLEATYADGSTVSFIDTALVASRNTLERTLAVQIKNLNKIVSATPEDVNFYFFAAPRFQDTELFEKYIPDETSTHDLFMQFFDGLDSRVTYDYLRLDSLTDRIEKMFLSDHHWNGYGSYCGYTQIVEMMRKDSPSIIEPRPLGEPFTFTKSQFFGSYARQSVSSRIYDDLVVYDYNFSDHISVPEYDFAKYVEWLDADVYRSPSYNLYAMFYPEMYRIEYPENNTGRRLLILGDSFAQGFAQLIGSSFDLTMFHYYANYSGLNYKKIIEDNMITDVLFIQFSERIMFNLYGEFTFGSYWE